MKMIKLFGILLCWLFAATYGMLTICAIRMLDWPWWIVGTFGTTYTFAQGCRILIGRA